MSLETQGSLSTWRVTAENPVRTTTGLDHERCAALHNELLEKGWVASGTDSVLQHRSWFEVHGEQAEQARSRGQLSASLVSFLEQAFCVEDVGEHSLFYYVNGLSGPGYMWEQNAMENEEQPYRYITLYVANILATHPNGLVFDQELNRAIMQMSIFDSDITHNGRQEWQPLEVVLSAWLDMADAGKVQAVDADADIEVPNDKFDPWISVPFSEVMLQDTLEAFESLFDAIESRLPQESSSRAERRFQPLLAENVLDQAGIRPDRFLRFLATRLRRPSFEYIAPGLRLPAADSFASQQPFSEVNPDSSQDSEDAEDPTVLRPILLFPSVGSFSNAADYTNGNERCEPPFPTPYDEVEEFPAGLYVNPLDRRADDFEDGVKLVLPFGVGSRGFARTADGARFGENKEKKGTAGRARDTFDELYQLGYSPFIERHNVRLVQVIRAWKDSVESGLWTIGENGVEGGIEKFREADTQDNWRSYTVPMSW